MSRWFRMYDELLDDPKVQRLRPELFKAWVNLMCLTSRLESIPSVGDVAFALRIDEDKAKYYVDELIELGLIDVTPDDVVIPHNWDKRQYKSDKDETAAKRQAEKRERDKVKPVENVTRDVTDKSQPPETDTDTDTDTDIRKDRAPSRSPATNFPDDFSLSDETNKTAIKLGFSPTQILDQIERMRDWSKQADGTKGRKKDWQAFARNWLKRQKEQSPNAQNPRPNTIAHSSQVLDDTIAARARELDALIELEEAGQGHAGLLS